jgi:hypothetical protein
MNIVVGSGGLVKILMIKDIMSAGSFLNKKRNSPGKEW